MTILYLLPDDYTLSPPRWLYPIYHTCSQNIIHPASCRKNIYHVSQKSVFYLLIENCISYLRSYFFQEDYTFLPPPRRLPYLLPEGYYLLLLPRLYFIPLPRRLPHLFPEDHFTSSQKTVSSFSEKYVPYLSLPPIENYILPFPRSLCPFSSQKTIIWDFPAILQIGCCTGLPLLKRLRSAVNHVLIKKKNQPEKNSFRGFTL